MMKKEANAVIYLDAAASSPLAPSARAAMLAALDGPPGNPGAAHNFGRHARDIVAAAREQIANLMDVGPGSVLFTASATEANNLAITGLLSSTKRNRIVTIATEHPAVLRTVHALAAAGADVRVVPVDSHGQPVLEVLAAEIDEHTALVSVHAANNETGLMPDLGAVAELAHAAGAWLHTDASQLMAWGDARGVAMCDLVTVSSHKMHGPQGAAALIASRQVQRQLQPMLFGGGQERGLRSGTENVAALAGFGAAADLAHDSGAAAATEVAELRDRLLAGLRTAGVPLRDHAADAVRLPNILNVGLPIGFEGDVVLAQTPSVAASTGSACHVGTPEPSPVLRAMGLSSEEAAAALRLSLSRFTTETEVDEAVVALTTTLRRLSAVLCGNSKNEQEESFSA